MNKIKQIIHKEIKLMNKELYIYFVLITCIPLFCYVLGNSMSTIICVTVLPVFMILNKSCYMEDGKLMKKYLYTIGYDSNLLVLCKYLVYAFFIVLTVIPTLLYTIIFGNIFGIAFIPHFFGISFLLAAIYLYGFYRKNYLFAQQLFIVIMMLLFGVWMLVGKEMSPETLMVMSEILLKYFLLIGIISYILSAYLSMKEARGFRHLKK